MELIDCMPMYRFELGSFLDAFLFVAVKGVSLDSAYPMRQHISKSCNQDQRNPVKIGIRGISRLSPHDEENLKRAVALIGPIAVKVHVNENFLSYRSGVYYDTACRGAQRVNHALLVIGYGSDSVGGDFWVAKNSWGPEWGEGGYIRMARNTFYDCGITSVAFYIKMN